MRAIRSTRPRAASLSVHSRGFLTAAAYKLAQKQLPKMSETEKVALGCGTVGFDRDIFGLRAVRVACGGMRAFLKIGRLPSAPKPSAAHTGAVSRQVLRSHKGHRLISSSMVMLLGPFKALAICITITGACGSPTPDKNIQSSTPTTASAPHCSGRAWAGTMTVATSGHGCGPGRGPSDGASRLSSLGGPL